MSQQGERVGKRLMKRHGFKFRDDPCNFRIASDPEGVARNVYGGQGVVQWILKYEFASSELPAGAVGSWSGQIEIGSDHGAGTVLKWPFWHVYFVNECGGYWRIDQNKEDLTEGPARPT